MIAVDEWRSRGRWISTPDGKVFTVRLGPEDSNQVPVLVLHGFPTSSWDFAEAASRVAKTRPVLLFDFLGFGLSDKPEDYGYSLFEQADTAVLMAGIHGFKHAHLWAHDMGTSVATELLARRERGQLPVIVESVTLMNGSVHIELAHLTLSQRFLRSSLGALFAKLTTKDAFKAQMRKLFGKPVAESELDGMWELITRESGADRLPAISQYLDERKRFHKRWVGSLEHLDVPALIAWGKKDPVAVLAIAEQLAKETPGAKAEYWEELGHYPQVEDPAQVVATLEAFWSRIKPSAT